MLSPSPAPTRNRARIAEPPRRKVAKLFARRTPEKQPLVVGSDTFADSFVRHQNAKRCRPAYNMTLGTGMGGMLGAAGGLLVGVAVAAALPPAAPLTVFTGVMLGTMAGGAIAGGTTGPAMYHLHDSPAKPEALRKHAFHDMQVLPRRDDSKAVMAALKKARVVGRGRGRPVLHLRSIDAALEGIRLRGQPLTAAQREGIKEILQIQANECARREPLLARLDATHRAIEARRQELSRSAAIRHVKPANRQAVIAADPDLKRLAGEAARLHAALMLLPSQRAPLEHGRPVSRPLALVPAARSRTSLAISPRNALPRMIAAHPALSETAAEPRATSGDVAGRPPQTRLSPGAPHRRDASEDVEEIPLLSDWN